MNKSLTYIVGATVLVGGAYLFLKNKKAKDLAKLDKLGGATTTGGATTGGTTTGGTTTGGTTTGGATLSEITPNLSQPVKVDKDLNLDTYNLQNTLQEFKKLEEDRNKPQPKFQDRGTEEYSRQFQPNREYYLWLDTIVRPYQGKKLILIDRLAKLGYKYDNGLLVKI